MLRLRSCIVTHLLSSPTASPISSLRRLLSAAPAVSTSPSFAVEDYLVGTCGLTRAQALKASTKLSHLKSPSKPDAVVAFLAGLGFSSADVAAAVAKNPKLLCMGVERTLAPMVAELTGLGLSRSEIASLFLLSSVKIRLRSIVSKVQYYLTLLGSSENLLRAIKRSYYLLTSDLERVTKLNVAFLQECGLGACDIAKLCIRAPCILSINPQRFRKGVELAKGLDVPCSSGAFIDALESVTYLSEEKMATQAEYLKKAFRWSDAETRIAISKAPSLLRRSKDMLQSRSEFLISEVGLEPAYIAHRPSLVNYSPEGRTRPRYYAVKFLKANGLLDLDRDYFSTVTISEKVFLEKYICPHKEAAPHLAEDYAAACKGEVPSRLKFP
ncbi:transcription termination factor MTERF8, chloroplastic [Brachypodium distachyon]|uniref:Uncharacterized protein n=1 Tax=Brachypodium distachyon TaxID=15368 RepID=I1HW43_BRADI|nr:transcription termination factor MTERF8, chloroplastic [Brachypodium distachyon]XP_024316842.1 transcription termination factor MTERF8, chloroplastic [Brachypodium distachyon]XP_024316843.1 transcription termination factor MTERF8, chloroplastic [Brachypodium distachyon]PNT65682.1 hypothetical protein BRADI_3g00780v3 [Brachypodium distachyon]|eukprot:XP_024316841.1 transcription termination factor MTERF8, chloroplastic [Brachypodium distachyon]